MEETSSSGFLLFLCSGFGFLIGKEVNNLEVAEEWIGCLGFVKMREVDAVLL